MAVTSSTKQAGEAHFDHIHLIYEHPPPQHRPSPPTNPHTPRCRQVKDPRRRNQSEGAAGASEPPSSFPFIWMETDVVAGKSREDKHGRGDAAVRG